MKPLKSPYSKMYLVTPGVYDKLLNCLDEKDKKSTELLNIEKEREDRPGERVIEDITTGDFDPQPVEAIPPPVEEQQPQVEEFIPPTPEVFGQEQQVQPQDIIEEGEIIEPMQVPPGEPEISTQQQEPNPLRAPCAIPTDPNQVVKQPLFVPAVVKRGVKRNIQQVTPKLFKKPTLLVKKKPTLIAPQIFRQQQQPTAITTQIQNPEIVRVQQEEQIDPDISMPSTSTTLVAKPIKKIKIQSTRKPTVCPICMKDLARTWNLVRHVSTVHKNLGSVKELLESQVIVQQPTQQVQQPVVPQPTGAPVQVQNPTVVIKQPRAGFKYNRDIDTAMDENMQQFDTWIKPGKRKAAEAKLPTRRFKLGHLKPKPRDAKEEFESWN